MDRIPLVTLLIGVPAAAGLLLAFIRGDREELIRRVSLAASVIVLAISVILYLQFPGGSLFHFVEDHSWIPQFDIRYKVGVDGISLVMVVLTAVLTPLAILCSWKAVKKNVKGFFLSMLFLEAGMLGVFCALDLFLFYVFWEASLIPMYLLVGVWGGPRRIYAAVKFILYTLVGSLLMFAAILYCYWSERTFDIPLLQENLRMLGLTTQMWLFGAFGLAFAIKVPLFPLHTWLPDAHVEAPTAGSVILAGVLLKMGTYGFLRFAIPFFPHAAHEFAPAMVALSVVGIIYGALMAMAQSDIKKLIAYSSVSHLGFVMLGLFAFTQEAAQGGVIQMVNHGLSTGALFLLVGVIYEKTHKRGIEDFGGLAHAMPKYAAIFLIVALSSIGLPGLNGFVGEFLILLGSFKTFPVAAAISGLGVILGAIYLLRLYRLMFFGKLNRAEYRKTADVGPLEMAYLVPLVLLIILLGVLPGVVLEKTEASVEGVYQIIHGIVGR